MAFLDDLKALCIEKQAELGLSAGAIYLSSAAKMPSGSGPFLTIVETSGTGDMRMQNSATERPTAQIVARAGTYQAARSLLQNVFAAIGGVNGLHNVRINGVCYVNLTRRNGPSDLGLDDAGRPRVAMNIDAEKQPE